MIKKLLTSVREYKKDTILTPVFVTFESILEIIIPTLIASLIDNGIEQKNISFVLLMGLALTACAAVSLLMGFLSGRSAAIASAGFAKNLRHDVFYNVQKFSFSNIDKFSTASIITRLTTDITNVQNAYQMLIRLAVRAPMMIIFALIFSFRIDAGLSLIFLGVIPVLGVGLWLIITHVHPIFVRVFRTYDKLNNSVQENLHGIRVVKSYIREDYEEKKFEDVSQTIFKDFTKAESGLPIICRLCSSVFMHACCCCPGLAQKQ
jgi:ATP-binding cassette subfamily B protein